MFKQIKKAGLTVVSSILLLQTTVMIPQESKAQTNSQSTISQKAANYYKQAEGELPENYYVVYRIVDRIARANNLDKTPWRIIVTSNDNVNAYATDFNLLVFEKGILEQLEGNPSALACVIGHEMGHHTKQHLGYGPAKQEEARLEEIKTLEKEQLLAEQDAQTQALLGGAAGIGLQEAGGSVGGTGGQILNGLGVLIENTSQQKARNIEQIKAELEQEAEIRYQQRLTEINHNQEFEADELGYIYSVKAGFKPEGCLTTMDVLGRSHGSQLGSATHPKPEDRTKKIDDLMAEYPPTGLQTEGKNKLLISSDPLVYESFESALSDGSKVAGLKILPPGGDTKIQLEELFD